MNESESSPIQTAKANRQETKWDYRCMAVVGTAWTGPQFCGYKAKDRDANGRPCCGHHLGKMHGILWYGERYWYPEGTASKAQEWKFKHGDAR